jgi:hypothetical protein
MRDNPCEQAGRRCREQGTAKTQEARPPSHKPPGAAAPAGIPKSGGCNQVQDIVTRHTNAHTAILTPNYTCGCGRPHLATTSQPTAETSVATRHTGGSTCKLQTSQACRRLASHHRTAIKTPTADCAEGLSPGVRLTSRHSQATPGSNSHRIMQTLRHIHHTLTHQGCCFLEKHTQHTNTVYF